MSNCDLKVDEIMCAVANGLPDRIIVSFFAKKWGVSPRTVQRYKTEYYKRLREFERQFA